MIKSTIGYSVILMLAGSFFTKTFSQTQKTLFVKSTYPTPVITEDHPDVLKSENKAGFETGQIVKIDGTYHMFINEMFNRPHKDMRIAYWTSSDAIHWQRQSTIVESIPERSPFNPRSEVWVTAVEFNKQENAWNIFYVSYRAGDKEKGEVLDFDYAGRIWRAKSIVPGEKGIAGPYADMDIVLQPDENSQPWEGQQAVAAFNPYKVGNTWYAFYDGHTHIPKGDWPLGMATATALNGPWKRMPLGHNPIPISPIFNENLQVTELKEGRYLAVFDSMGDQEIGYSLSSDGISWTSEKRLKIQIGDHLWAEDGDHATRTPLGAIEEEDGTLTVLYTAMYKKNGRTFYGLGKCTLDWK